MTDSCRASGMLHIEHWCQAVMGWTSPANHCQGVLHHRITHSVSHVGKQSDYVN